MHAAGAPEQPTAASAAAPSTGEPTHEASDLRARIADYLVGPPPHSQSRESPAATRTDELMATLGKIDVELAEMKQQLGRSEGDRRLVVDELRD
jgi:hypothetical protein